MAREASEARKMTSYERRVQVTEVRLVDKMAGVCRDYSVEVWAEALNWAGVPVNSELREAKNTFFSEDIREVPAMLLPLVADPLPPSKHLSTIQAPFPNAEVSIRASKGKEVQSPTKVNRSEDAFTIRDIQLKAADSKEDPYKAKA